MAKRLFKKVKSVLDGKPLLAKGLFVIVVNLVIVLVLSPVLISYKHIGGFDWDTYVAYHEALRRIIVNYHQFPWWDPWIAGGVPLFGNPQIGLISIETPFILLFGTVFGLKLAAVTYFIAGFWGMFWLLKELDTRLSVRLLLSYVWVFSTFVTFHFYAGHFTFLMYLLSPWLFFLALKLRNDGWRWAVLLGIFIGFITNSDLHYMVLQAFLILGFWMIGEFITVKDKKKFILRALLAASIGLILALPHLYFAYKYVADFPAAKDLMQPVAGLRTTARAFLQPFQKPGLPPAGGLTWWEYSSYIGISTMLLFFIAAARHCYDTYKKKRVNPGVIFLIGFIACFVLGLGPFARLSPYNILHHVSLLKNTEVPSRWFGWCLFFVVLTISQFRKIPKLSVVLLSVAAIELTANLPFGKIFIYATPSPVANSAFKQHYDFLGPNPYSSNMYKGVISNYGVVPAYEPILRRSGINSVRCDLAENCNLISSNAQVTYWSPNTIKLKRLAPGPIDLDINPGSYWLVNGQRLFPNDRVTESGKQFVITDPANNIELHIKPAL